MCCIHRRKHDWKRFGSMRASTRPIVSCDGMPFGRDRKVFNHSCFSFPYCSMSEGPSAPQITAQMVRVTKCSMIVDVEISNVVSIVPFLVNGLLFYHFTSRMSKSRCDGPRAQPLT